MAEFKFTPEQVITALKETKGLHALAATKLGCSERTVRNYIERFPGVSEAVKHQKEGMLDIAEGKLYAAIQKGEAWAICFFLKTQGKARHYSERIQVTDADGNPLQPTQIIVISQQARELTQQIIQGKRTALGNNEPPALEAGNN